MAKIDKYLKLGVERHASDVHFSSNMPVSLRIDGDLVRVEEQPHSGDQMEAMILEILSQQERERLFQNKNLDRSYRVADLGNFRVNIFISYYGVGAVFRWIPMRVPSLTEVGLPPSIVPVIEGQKGLVLVTGPTGSGKSTTLAAMVDHLNATRKDHILTVEDPIEFVHQSKRSLVTQREIGHHCDSFADALKYALREDPDVILVGEMRDLETIALAMSAAETGHLVFGTLHTRGAAASVDRIIDSFPANQQAMIRAMLAESLQAVVSQTLLRRADNQGRIAAFEILIVNHAVSNLIREGKTFQIGTVMQTGRNQGMQLMDHHILELVRNGIVRGEEAEGHLSDPALLPNRPKKTLNPVTTNKPMGAPAPYGRQKAGGGAPAPGPLPGGGRPPAPPPMAGHGRPAAQPQAKPSAPPARVAPPSAPAAARSAPPVAAPPEPEEEEGLPEADGDLSLPSPGTPFGTPDLPSPTGESELPEMEFDAGGNEVTGLEELTTSDPPLLGGDDILGGEEDTGPGALPFGGDSLPPPQIPGSAGDDGLPEFSNDDTNVSGSGDLDFSDGGGLPPPPSLAEMPGMDSPPPAGAMPPTPSAAMPPPTPSAAAPARPPGPPAPPPITRRDPGPLPPPGAGEDDKTVLADHRMGLPPPPGSLFRKKKTG